MIAIIYQLPIESNNIFRKYNKEKFDFSEYKKVYEWFITEEVECEDVNELLKYIFYTFNCEIPKDFNDHSLSVSDIVVIGDSYYYCDNFGWKNISKEIF